MNKFLSNLNIMYVKLHNYHYNVVGSDFMPTHLLLEDEYNSIHEWIDVIAEEIKKAGKYPLGSMKDYLENSTISEISSVDYRSNEIYMSVIDDYKELISNMEEIKKTSSDVLIDLLNTYIDILIKKIWLMKSTIK